MGGQGGRKREGKQEFRYIMYMCQLHTRNVNIIYCVLVLIKKEMKILEIKGEIENGFGT